MFSQGGQEIQYENKIQYNNIFNNYDIEKGFSLRRETESALPCLKSQPISIACCLMDVSFRYLDVGALRINLRSRET